MVKAGSAEGNTEESSVSQSTPYPRPAAPTSGAVEAAVLPTGRKPPRETLAEQPASLDADTAVLPPPKARAEPKPAHDKPTLDADNSPPPKAREARSRDDKSSEAGENKASGKDQPPLVAEPEAAPTTDKAE